MVVVVDVVVVVVVIVVVVVTTVVVGLAVGIEATIGRYTTSISSSFSILLLGLEGGTISCNLDSVTSYGSIFSIDGLMSYLGGAGASVGGGGGGDFLDETSLKGFAS